MQTTKHLLPILVIAVVAEIACSAPAQTGPATTAGQKAATVYSKNPEANALFLKALEFYNHADPRTGGTFENGREAIRLFRKAVNKDPRFALAYVDMARAYLTLGYSNPGAASDAEIMSSVKAALHNAALIDPKLADAHLLSAAVAYNLDYDWERADREYRQSLALQPDNASAHANYAAFLGNMGRFPEALGQAAKAEALGSTATTDFAFARIYYWMRRYDVAESYCRKSLAKQDNLAVRFYLGLMLAAANQYDKAIPELEATTKENNGGALAGLAYAYAMVGKTDAAQELLARLFANRESGLVVPYRVAAVYLALGDRAQAIEWLDLSYSRHENWMAQLKVDPVMDPLRSDVRFQDLMRRMHFDSSKESAG